MHPRLLKLLNNNERNYPHSLAQQFPRILSKIMDLWDSPEIDDYFSSLMIADRHNREGFPKEVVSDVMYLSMVHTKLKDTKEATAKPWADVNEGAKEEIEKLGIPLTPKGFLDAVESGSQEVITLFLDAGFNIDTTDERLWTPLMVSAFNGNMEMAEFLIENGAKIDHHDSAGYTPLHWAAFNGYTAVIRLLLNKEANANSASNHGWTALLQAATRGHLTVCSILIEHQANVDAASNDGWTPLHKATANEHLPVVCY